jgi:hypothetical protein
MAKGSPQNRITQLEKQGQSTSASFSTVPYAGAGHHDSTTGFHPVPETLDFIWALVQPSSEAPVENAEDARPCAWSQVIPQEDGSWVSPENGLSGTVEWNPAYEENDADFSANTIVKLYPGKTVFVDGVLSQDWRFSLGKDDGTTGNSSDFLFVRPYGDPINQDGSIWYQATGMARGLNNGVRSSVGQQKVFLRQWYDFDLSAGTEENDDSGGVYFARFEESKTLDVDGEMITKDAYITVEFGHVVTNVTCDPFIVTQQN